MFSVILPANFDENLKPENIQTIFVNILENRAKNLEKTLEGMPRAF